MAAAHTSTRAGGALLSCVRRVHMAGVALCPHGANLALARQRVHDLHTCHVVETAVPHMHSGRASVLPSPLTYATEQLLKAPTLPHQQHSSLHTQAEDAETLRAIEDAIGPLSTAPLLAPPQPVVVVISGPSGVGKDAVIQRLKEKMTNLYFVVTATSRPKRVGEVEGRDYFFVSKEKFEGWIEAGMLLEHAVVYGEYKGIPRQQVDEALAAGTDVLLRIDVQGAATVRRLIPHAVSIFIAAETEDELVRRLVARKTEALDKLKTRVQTARQELAHVQNFDYVVVNPDGQMEQCVDQIASIIAAEKLAVRRRQQHAQRQQQQQQAAQ